MSAITQCKRCREYNAAAVDYRNQATRAQADYAALLARHTALVGAVAWESECNDVDRVQWDIWNESPSGDVYDWYDQMYEHTYKIWKAARAEVDRLLGGME